ncbi:MAG: hypothetical protein APF80_13895 [Alphaproteobacteria bacterium BRH_c36]|nr:MAG: hypothetical protein APF80_13895 [Alphaproteobacteria bacterium BRH_c36]
MTPAVGPLSRFCLLLAAGALALALPVGSHSLAVAQSTETKTKATPADGRKTVIEGIKAYEAGKMDKAVATLSGAVKSGGLSSQDLAKAFYYRGLAYQRSGQSAQAIADLTNAVWMKGGLSPEEQQTALEARGKAYAAVGVQDPGPPGTSIGTPSLTAQASGVAAPAVSPAKPADVGAPPKSIKAAPAAGFATQVVKAPDVSSEAEGSAPSSDNPLSGVGNFFSNLFSGGSSSAPPATAPSATASIGAPATEEGAPSAVSAWSSETSVSVAKADPARVRKTAVRKTAAAAVATDPAGAYKLQVAAVRSRDEAERLASQLKQKHSGPLGARVPDISETVFGNMGTFYQVNVGPFALTSETDKVCKVLKADGYDCLVVKK